MCARKLMCLSFLQIHLNLIANYHFTGSKKKISLLPPSYIPSLHLHWVCRGLRDSGSGTTSQGAPSLRCRPASPVGEDRSHVCLGHETIPLRPHHLAECCPDLWHGSAPSYDPQTLHALSPLWTSPPSISPPNIICLMKAEF